MRNSSFKHVVDIVLASARIGRIWQEGLRCSMQKVAAIGPTISLCVYLIFFPNVGLAVTEVFQGLLIPASFDPPIPITVSLENSSGRLSGRVKTSLPLPGDGPITSGNQHGSTCLFTTHISNGVRMRLEGKCSSATLEGNYRIYFPDGRRVLGTFRLNLLPPDKTRKDPSELDPKPSATTASACLRANFACLAECPRGSDVEAICANTCTLRLAACRARGRPALEPPA